MKSSVIRRLGIFVISTVFLTALTGCATVQTNMIAGTQSPGVHNKFLGILYVELGGLSDARPVMIRECERYGGLNEGSILNRTPDGAVAGLNSLVGSYWFYSCNGFSQPKTVIREVQTPSVAPQPSATQTPQRSPVLIEDARKTCTDLGFKAGSEKFGDCILRLTR